MSNKMPGRCGVLARRFNAIGAIVIASLCTVSASCSLWAIVHGPLLVDGQLKIVGPLTMEASGPVQVPDPEPLQYQQSLQDWEQTL